MTAAKLKNAKKRKLKGITAHLEKIFTCVLLREKFTFTKHDRAVTLHSCFHCAIPHCSINNRTEIYVLSNKTLHYVRNLKARL